MLTWVCYAFAQLENLWKIRGWHEEEERRVNLFEAQQEGLVPEVCYGDIRHIRNWTCLIRKSERVLEFLPWSCGVSYMLVLSCLPGWLDHPRGLLSHPWSLTMPQVVQKKSLMGYSGLCEDDRSVPEEALVTSKEWYIIQPISTHILPLTSNKITPVEDF